MLANNESLRKLEIEIEWIKTESFVYLCESLKQNNNLVHLHFKNMAFNNTEMELLIEGMYKNQHKNVSCLKFHGVKFESECLKSLSTYLKDVNPKQF